MLEPTSPEPLSSGEFARLMTPFEKGLEGDVAVAVSGGADSLALALLLADWARTRGVNVCAITVDHGLRAGSADEARKVGAWLADLGLQHTILTWTDGAAIDSGVQAQARDARYALMAEWCRAHAIGQLFVAHHMGDQAETFVMRLKRASTLFGLKAMTPVREVQGVCVCRPLLPVAKARLQATLRGRGQAWVEDPSNLNTSFERVRTRALIEALQNEGVTAERLAGAAGAAGRVTEILDAAAAAFEAAAVAKAPHAGPEDAGLEIDKTAFRALPRVVRERVVSRLLSRVGGRAYAPSPAKVERLTAWMMREPGAAGAARTLGQCVVRVSESAFSIAPEGPRTHFRRAKKPGFFAIAPLPRAAKGLTSRPLGGAPLRAKC